MFDGQETQQNPAAPNAFTLIELLVVIAIIGILAAMLLPSLTRAKAQADSAYCKNNLHQQGLALRMYVDDFKVYPYYEIAANLPNHPSMWWEAAIGHYYQVPGWNTNRACLCPAYTGQTSAEVAEDLVADYATKGSYAYNTYGDAAQWPAAEETGFLSGLGMGWFDAAQSPPQPHRESENRSADPIGCYYGFSGTTRIAVRGRTLHLEVQLVWDLTVRCNLHHSMASFFNVLFCDGHVLAILISDLFDQNIMGHNWNVDNKP